MDGSIIRFFVRKTTTASAPMGFRNAVNHKKMLVKTRDGQYHIIISLRCTFISSMKTIYISSEVDKYRDRLTLHWDQKPRTTSR